MVDEEKNLVEILEEQCPIDLAKYMNFVHASSCGAIATFSGNTRDTFEGKSVVELRYEAYVPMAMRQIKSLCSHARSSWNLSSIAVAHRLGSVPVGETSVFVAISAVHRADALDACKFMIDEIKASVPIWKKEVFTDGEVWKENAEYLVRRMELMEGARLANLCDKATVGQHIEKSCCSRKVKVENIGTCSHMKDAGENGG